MLSVFIMYVISKSSKLKGIIGEKFIEYRLSKLDPQKYKMIHDVLIPSRNGRTTQIDHIVLFEYGFFVIETKNYRGWIVGNENAEYWTQVIYKRKEKLYNPLRQNFGHVEALKAVLSDITDLHFIPVVSFSGRADLKVETKAIVNYNSQINNIKSI
jgi:predicted membrane GTPase involved in stress response